MAEYVDIAAQLIGLPIRPEDRDDVIAEWKRIEEVAAVLLDFPLDQSIEPAPVFEP